jgi:hypothetical protein
VYRLSQVDDYSHLPRHGLLWRAPARLELRARVSADALPGTWGFGLWNDPFSFSIGLGGMSRRFPALPNAAWFFYASSSNYLSFRDDLPADGLLAATFSSPRLPAWMVGLGSLGLPLGFVPPLGRILRRVVRRFVKQDASRLELDPAIWHTYRLEWEAAGVAFYVDGERVYEAQASPVGPLGLVVWIDNQYAAWRPDGRLRYGFEDNPEPAWMEVVDLQTGEL